MNRRDTGLSRLYNILLLVFTRTNDSNYRRNVFPDSPLFLLPIYPPDYLSCVGSKTEHLANGSYVICDIP